VLVLQPEACTLNMLLR